MHIEGVSAGQIGELVARAKAGDRMAFDRLVELHMNQVYNLALRITGSTEDAEDCTQDVFLRAYSSLRSFRGEAAFATWLYRVALHVSLDAAKKRSRNPLPASALAGDPDDPPPDFDRVIARQINTTGGLVSNQKSPEEALVAKERRRVLLQAISHLPEHQRVVFVLCDLQGLSYEEIARIINTKVGTVKSRLNRARLSLKELLTKHLELLRD